MSRNSKIWMFFLALGLVVLIIVGHFYTDNQVQSNDELFNKASIHGELKYVGVAAHGSGFEIKSDSNRYVFYPYTSDDLNDGKIFTLFAKAGDSVTKTSYSDTLYLKKEGRIYKYLFKK